MEMLEKKKRKLFNYSNVEKRKFTFIYVTLLLPVLHLLVFWVYVNISSIFLAFKDTSDAALTDNWPFSLYSFKEVLKAFFTGKTTLGVKRNPWVLFGKSILIWVNSHVICNVISMITAFMLTKHMIGSKFFRTVYYIPGIVGAVVFSTIMTELYAVGGPVMKLLEGLGVDLPTTVTRNNLLQGDSTAFITLFLQQFILGIGGGNMIIAGAYMKVPEEIFESARIDGCSFFREVFQIAVPCIWSTVSTLLIFGLCSIFVADLNFYLYVPDPEYPSTLENMGFYMYTLRVSVSKGSDSTWAYGYGAALGLIITLITVPVVYLGKFILAKMSDNVEF